MNTLVVFAAVMGIAVARSLGGQVISLNPHTLGNYNLNWNGGLARTEHRNIFGEINGGYSYVNPYPLSRTSYVTGQHGFEAIGRGIPLPIQDTREIAIANPGHLGIFRKAELSPLVPEILETPLVAPAEVVDISQLPLARSSYINTVPFGHAPLVRIADVPESPEVLDFESKQFAAHVAHKNHLLI